MTVWIVYNPAVGINSVWNSHGAAAARAAGLGAGWTAVEYPVQEVG